MTKAQQKVLSPEEIAQRVTRTHEYVSQQDTVKNIAAAKLAHHLLDEILTQLKPGVRESEIKQYALDCFARNNIEKTWHPPYVRFGDNTLLTYMDKAHEDRVLGEDDIAFVDIGIVLDGIEGDAGRTVSMGNDTIKLALREASQSLFHTARDFWKKENPSGVVLYDFIHEQAKKQGFEFILDPAGHLIGEFPHRGWKRGINHFPETIDPAKWILEIQIRHPELPIGSFYENLLY
ncbi:MAG: M24 family metallopeptidase [Rickettsiales bacterium]